MQAVEQGVLFLLIGAMIGIFGTLLFFRMDKGWKQILVGLLSAGCATGAGGALFDFLNVSSGTKSLMTLLLVVGIIVSVYFSFRKLCNLLKTQTGNNAIRVLDIVLGYDGFIKDYYETRKKDIDITITSERNEKKELQLKS